MRVWKRRVPCDWKPVQIYDIPLYIATGIFAFSGMSFYITRFVLGLPLYTPELLLLPFAMIKWRAVRRALQILAHGMLHDLKLPIYLLIWILMIALGYVITWNIADVLASARPILYILLIAYVAAKSPLVNARGIFWLTFGAMIGELIHIMFFYKLYVVLDDRFVVGVNLIAVFLCISLSVVYRKVFMIFTCLTVASFLILGSAFRIVLIVTLLAFSGSYFMLLWKGGRGKFLWLVVGSIAVVVAGGLALHFVGEGMVRDYAQFRVIDRTMRLLSGDIAGSQDIARIEKMKWIWTGVIDRWLPKGFVSKAIDEIGNHNDVPIVYFYDTIGASFSLIFLPWLLAKGTSFLFAEFKRRTLDFDTTASIGVMLFMVLLLVNGRFLYITYEAWLFGIILGRWFSKRKSKIIVRTITPNIDRK